LVANVLEADVNESYLDYLVALRTKLAFCSNDPLVKKAAALQDVEPELEKLRVKATARVRDFMLQVRWKVLTSNFEPSAKMSVSFLRRLDQTTNNCA
jgi:hypothetical protein